MLMHGVLCCQNLIENSSTSCSLCLSSTRADLLLDDRHEVLRLLRAGPPVLDLSIASNKELLKVPLHPLQPHEARLLVLEPLKRRVRIRSIHIDLAQHRERDSVIDLAEFLDLIVAAGILSTELVARKANDLEVVRVLLLQVFVEFLEAGELRCEAAL